MSKRLLALVTSIKNKHSGTYVRCNCTISPAPKNHNYVFLSVFPDKKTMNTALKAINDIK